MALNGLEVVVSVSAILPSLGLIVANCETIIGCWRFSGGEGWVTLTSGRVQQFWRREIATAVASQLDPTVPLVKANKLVIMLSMRNASHA
jgi:hypothetical protein